MKNLNRSRRGIAFTLDLIMMMWEFADLEKGLEHIVEWVCSMISYAMHRIQWHRQTCLENMVTS